MLEAICSFLHYLQYIPYFECSLLTQSAQFNELLTQTQRFSHMHPCTLHINLDINARIYLQIHAQHGCSCAAVFIVQTDAPSQITPFEIRNDNKILHMCSSKRNSARIHANKYGDEYIIYKLNVFVFSKNLSLSLSLQIWI